MQMKNLNKLILILTLFTFSVNAQMTVSKTGLSLPANSDPIIFKTNNAEQMRILPNGNIGIGNTMPAYKLDVNGNTNINGTLNVSNTFTAIEMNITGTLLANQMALNRIRAVHPDSVIYFGDSTLVIDGNRSKIYSDERGISVPRGVAIGRGFIPTNGSASSGTMASGRGSTAIGYNVRTTTVGQRSIVIGSGIFGVSTFLTNDIPNTLMVGFNSTIPTLFVSEASGAGTTGNVSIGGETTNLLHKLHVNGKMYLSDGVIQKGGATPVGTGDLGLYSMTNTWMRFVTNGQPIKFFIDGSLANNNGIGGNPAMVILDNGNVLINQDAQVNSAYKLDVSGPVRANEIVVNTDGADFVFDKNYKLMTLKELEKSVSENKHLPGIAPASEMQKNGVGLAELNTLLLQKVEELTLYVIELNKKIEVLESK